MCVKKDRAKELEEYLKTKGAKFGKEDTGKSCIWTSNIMKADKEVQKERQELLDKLGKI